MNRNLDFIHLNNFAKFHNADNVWFCKTDFLYQDFAKIRQLDHNVIFITGNSDYAITDDIISNMPDNIVKWYCQNAHTNNSVIEPIPIGMENKDFCVREGHGIGYGDRVQEKIDELNQSPQETPSRFMYANFNIQTNISHRSSILNIARMSKHIDWTPPTLSFKTMLSELKKYKMVLCPAGNGVDTHRLWETLYAGRIPVTVKIGNHKIYQLYKKLPIIVLEDMEELRDEIRLSVLYNQIIGSKYNIDIAYQTYWNLDIENNIRVL